MDVSEVGPLPTQPAPSPGERLTLSVTGEPPEKTFGRSMRNARSPQRGRFLALREAAIDAMAGRKWYEGPVGLALTYWAPDPPGVFDHSYISGVMDTLGGSHGPTFIYLPIVYLDDCQVSGISARPVEGPTVRYEIELKFMPGE